LEYSRVGLHAAGASAEILMRSCLLILLGVPLPIVFLLWFLSGHL
jgi:hypothetical protein